MPLDLALLSTLIGWNHPCFELIFMVPKVFEPLKFDCIMYSNIPKTVGLLDHDKPEPNRSYRRMS